MKIAIVYDWIDKWGGVERVLLVLHKLLPKAIFYTSYYDKNTAPWAKDLPIRTSFIQKLPTFIKKNRALSVLLYPYAFESFDLSSYDVVISVTSSFAKGIITKPETKHICYLLTPTRFLWLYPELYISRFKNILANRFIAHLQKWDKIAAMRPDTIISISKTVQARTQKIYNRDSEVIYPPFDVDYWDRIKSKVDLNTTYDIRYTKYHLLVSRLEPYKKVELVLRLFKQLKLNLIVVGDGSQFKQLQSYTSSNITFLKKVTDEELALLYQQAEALIMPQEEDFGLVSLEAQFFGCPVIAYKKGGATETVIENETGIFFDEQSIDSLKSAIAKYDKIGSQLKERTKIEGIINVEKFSGEIFEKNFLKFLQ